MGCFTNPGAWFSKDGKRVGFFFLMFFVLFCMGVGLVFQRWEKGCFFFFNLFCFVWWFVVSKDHHPRYDCPRLCRSKSYGMHTLNNGPQWSRLATLLTFTFQKMGSSTRAMISYFRFSILFSPQVSTTSQTNVNVKGFVWS